MPGLRFGCPLVLHGCSHLPNRDKTKAGMKKSILSNEMAEEQCQREEVLESCRAVGSAQDI